MSPKIEEKDELFVLDITQRTKLVLAYIDKDMKDNLFVDLSELYKNVLNTFIKNKDNQQ